MSRALLIYMVIFIGTAFMFTPFGPKIQPFLLSDRQLYAETYAYYLWQHLVLILLFHVVQVEANKFIQFYRCMFWWQVMDMVDYLLTYNDVWLKIDGQPVLTMNILGAVVCGWFLAKDWTGNNIV